VANAYDHSPVRKDLRDDSSPYPQSGLTAADLTIDVADLAIDAADGWFALGQDRLHGSQ